MLAGSHSSKPSVGPMPSSTVSVMRVRARGAIAFAFVVVSVCGLFLLLAVILGALLATVPISTYVELQQQYLAAVESLLDTKREALEAAAQLELLTGLLEPLVISNAKQEAK